MKQDDAIGVLESLLPEDFAQNHAFPPGWGGRFARNKEASTEVAELLDQFVTKQQAEKAKRPQKQSVEWLESVWSDEEELRPRKWEKWVLECAKNPDDLKLRVKALKDERAAKQREREERKKREEEEAERKRLEEEARREALRKMEEERKRREAEEAERLRLEKEARREARRKQAEERKKREEEEAERQKLEEEERRKAKQLEKERREEERKKREAEKAERERLAEERREAQRLERERREAERKKREEEKAEKQRLAALQAEARREAQRQERERREAERKKQEEERAERQRLAEQEEEERREARRRELAAQEAERRRLEAEEAERVRREELEERRRELDRRWAENAARRRQQAMENQKVGWTYVIGVGIAIGLLFGLWVISRGFDVPVAKTGLIWPWCWWHIKFVVGVGIVLDIILAILVSSIQPGTRNTISDARYKEIGNQHVSGFIVVCVLITLGMFIYALCHLFSVLGFSVRALGTGLLFVVEFPVVGMLGVLLTFLCNGLLWGHYE